MPGHDPVYEGWPSPGLDRLALCSSDGRDRARRATNSVARALVPVCARRGGPRGPALRIGGTSSPRIARRARHAGFLRLLTRAASWILLTVDGNICSRKCRVSSSISPIRLRQTAHVSTWSAHGTDIRSRRYSSKARSHGHRAFMCSRVVSGTECAPPQRSVSRGARPPSRARTSPPLQP